MTEVTPKELHPSGTRSALTIRSASGSGAAAIVDLSTVGTGFVFNTGGTTGASVTIQEVQIENASTGSAVAFNADKQSTLNIIDSVFDDNDITDCGGAIYAEFPTRALSGTPLYVVDISGSTFTSNSSETCGGAVAVVENSVGAGPRTGDLTVSINSSTFDTNGVVQGSSRAYSSGEGSGGAVFVEYGPHINLDSEVTITDTDFTNNTSSGPYYPTSGGPYTEFARGGAIYAIVDAMTVSVSSEASNRFSSNEAIYTGSFNGGGNLEGGGAIYIEAYKGVSISDTEFTSNVAGSSTRTYSYNDNYAEGGAVLALTDDLIISDSTFGTGNTDENSAHGFNAWGGAVAQIILGDGSGFTCGVGGAVLCTIIQDSDFTENASDGDDEGVIYGGAVAILGFTDKDTEVVIDGTNFTSNNSLGRGGAVYAGFPERSNAVTAPDYSVSVSGATFTANASDTYGGGLVVEGQDYGTASFMGNLDVDIDSSTFSSNIVNQGSSRVFLDGEGSGGGVFINFAESGLDAYVTVTDTDFTDNIANGPYHSSGGPYNESAQGGAIYAIVSSLSVATALTSTNSFSGNEAVYAATFNGTGNLEGGGAIYADAPDGVSISDSVFTSNVAGSSIRSYLFDQNYAEGGAVLAISDDLTVVGSVFGTDATDGNTANGFNSFGGAIAHIVLGTAGPTATSTVTDSTFESNRIGGSASGLIYGGAMAVLELAGTVNTTAIVEGTSTSTFLTTFDNNLAEDNAIARGGAVYFYGLETIQVNAASFTGNETDGYGGGISAYLSDSLEITDAYFEQNVAGRSGGGVSAELLDDFLEEGSIYLQNESDGTAPYDGGGGIYLYRIGTSIVRNDTEFTENDAEGKGGGIFATRNDGLYSATSRDDQHHLNYYYNRSDTLTIGTGSTPDVFFTDNTAGNAGGGLAVTVFPDVSVEQTEFTDNAVIGDGGGIALEQVQAASIDESWLGPDTTGNVASGLGGGIYAHASTPIDASFTLTHSLVLSNTFVRENEAYGGGGVAVGGVGTIIHASHLYQNLADEGGGLRAALTSVSVERSSIWNNQAIGSSSSGDGGGILVVNGDVSTINTTLDENESNGNGSAATVRSIDANASLSLEFSTVFENGWTSSHSGGSGKSVHLETLDSAYTATLNSEKSIIFSNASGSECTYSGPGTEIGLATNVLSSDLTCLTTGSGITTSTSAPVSSTVSTTSATLFGGKETYEAHGRWFEPTSSSAINVVPCSGNLIDQENSPRSPTPINNCEIGADEL
jgi:hypothetical protein